METISDYSNGLHDRGDNQRKFERSVHVGCVSPILLLAFARQSVTLFSRNAVVIYARWSGFASGA